MNTLDLDTNPTAESGALSMSTEMTAVIPSREYPLAGNEEGVAELRDSGLNVGFICDTLSAMQAHERCGLHLYRSVASRSNNPILVMKYKEFGAETEQHIGILVELMTVMGFDPQYVSPMARLTEKSDSGLVESTFILSGSSDLMTQEMVMLEAVMLAEAKDHDNWKMLSMLAPDLPDGPIRDAVERAVARVEEQEDEHLRWASETRHKMVRLQARSETIVDIGEKAEEVVERIRSWFGND